MRRLERSLASVAIVASLAACAGESTSSATPQPGDACDAFAAVTDSVAAFQDLDPATASIDDYRDAGEDARDAWGAWMMLRGSEAAQAEYQMRLTLSELATSLRLLPSDTTPEEAIEAVQPQIDDVNAALDSIAAEQECDEPS